MPVNHFAFLENAFALVFSLGMLFLPVHGKDRVISDIGTDTHPHHYLGLSDPF